MSVSPTAIGDRLLAFPRERTWLLPALDAIQRAAGSVSAEALTAVAEHLRVPLSEVWGVATHYPEIRLTPPGRHLVRVCTGVSCAVVGGAALLGACEQRLGVRAGATTPDGAITLEALDCAFACGVAPVIEVGHRRVGRVVEADLERLLDPSIATREGGGTFRQSVASFEPPSAGDQRPHSPAARFAVIRREAERRRTGARLAVGVGTCGDAVGARETHERLREDCARRDLPFSVVAAGCNGMCWAAPVVEVLRDGRPRLTVGPVPASAVARLLEAVGGNSAADEFGIDPALLRNQHRLLLDRCGLADPSDIADAIRHGTYATFASSLDDGRPERIIDEVRAAGLRGRGGAYFQTAIKWAACRAAAGAPKFIVMNGEEGEPGIFKDRHLMEGDPHRIIEGVLLAAFAVGASRAILYIHGEADLSAARMTAAVDEARACGLVGDGVLGSSFSVDVEIRRGLGGFVLGEETALLESIEGRRAMPRTRPPFPVEYGLWGQPTVINNVETLCAVPWIVERGGAWFASLGRGQGTKLFGLSGHLRRPGVVEVEVGCTLRTLIDELGGGSSTPRAIGAAVVGGPSGSIVHPRDFDEPLIPGGRVNPGTGGVIALDEAVSIRDVVKTLLAFNARESCGKCTPCREGTARLLALLERPLEMADVTALAEVIQVASLCGLGQAAPYAVLSGLTEFPDAFTRVS